MSALYYHSWVALAGIVDSKEMFSYLNIKNKAMANDLAQKIKDIKAEGLFETFQKQASRISTM